MVVYRLALSIAFALLAIFARSMPRRKPSSRISSSIMAERLCPRSIASSSTKAIAWVERVMDTKGLSRCLEVAMAGRLHRMGLDSQEVWVYGH